MLRKMLGNVKVLIRMIRFAECFDMKIPEGYYKVHEITGARLGLGKRITKGKITVRLD